MLRARPATVALAGLLALTRCGGDVATGPGADAVITPDMEASDSPVDTVDDAAPPADLSPPPTDAAPEADAAPEPPDADTGGPEDAPGTPDLGPDAPAAPDVSDVSDVSDASPASQSWRSSLYPEDWQPGLTRDGRFLHDFSWAGYHSGQGEPPPPALAALPTQSVVDHGADPTGASDSTAAITAAIAAAAASAGEAIAPAAVVRFPAGTYRVDGTLAVQTSGVWLVGEGSDRSRLHFTRTAGMSFGAHLRFAGRPGDGPDLPLATDGAAWATEVTLSDASSLGVGDEVSVGWVITPAFVEAHGMTGTWGPMNGQWQPFFRRRVVAVDTQSVPHRVTLDVPLRYPALLRDAASLRKNGGLLRECGLVGLGVANAGDPNAAWALDQVHAVSLEHVADCVVRDLASYPSPSASAPLLGTHPHLLSGGLIVSHSRRVTVADSHLAKAQHRGTGGNGYLFEVRQSGEILFRDLTATGGRHNFIQNWGFGATGIVWLRVRSSGGRAYPSQASPLFTVGRSEFHHSLAMANLIDSCWSDDGWSASNRLKESSGAGHTATESVFWNIAGPGDVRSFQFGHGYVIGSAPETPLQTERPADLDPAVWPLVDPISPWSGTEPWDFVEGAGQGATLEPASLYEDQLARRRARVP